MAWFVWYNHYEMEKKKYEKRVQPSTKSLGNKDMVITHECLIDSPHPVLINFWIFSIQYVQDIFIPTPLPNNHWGKFPTKTNF